MSVIRDFQVSALYPSIVGGTGTAVKYFPRVLGASIGNQSTTPSTASAVGQLDVPAMSELDGEQFEVTLGLTFGSDTGSPSGTVTLGLYAQTSATPTSPTYTAIGTSGALTPNLAAAGDILLKFTLFGSTKSGLVQGIKSGVWQGGIIAAAATTNLSGITFSGAGLGLPSAGIAFGLVAGVTFGTSDATNTARLTQFQISTVA